MAQFGIELMRAELMIMLVSGCLGMIAVLIFYPAN